MAYRIPDTNINLSGSYQQGKGNIQVSCVPDESLPLLGPNGELYCLAASCAQACSAQVNKRPGANSSFCGGAAFFRFCARCDPRKCRHFVQYQHLRALHGGAGGTLCFRLCARHLSH